MMRRLLRFIRSLFGGAKQEAASPPSILENYPGPKPGEERRIFNALPGTIIDLEAETGINRWYIAVLLRRMQARGLVVFLGGSQYDYKHTTWTAA